MLTANTGSVYQSRGKWRCKVTVGSRRPSFTLCATTKESARARARVLAEIATRAHDLPGVDAMLRDLASATDGELERLRTMAGQAIARARAGKGMTVRALAASWQAGEISRRYPDHVRPFTMDYGRVLPRIVAAIGDVPVSELSLEDLDRFATSLPVGLAVNTRAYHLRVVSRLVRIAVYPMRLLPHDPIPRGWVPTGKPAVFPYLYPVEEARLLGCVEVPLERRVLYGLTAREGMRKGEVLGLRWTDIDLDLGTLSLTKTKTNEPRTWKLGEDTVKALRIWREMVKGPTVFSFPREVDQHLRPDLLTAGITRKELHKPELPRKPLRFHDLRATFVTLALAVGRPERWVMARTGHTTSNMLSRYHRQARLAEELDQGWLTNMVESIPEFRGTNSSGSGQESPKVSTQNKENGGKARKSKGLPEPSSIMTDRGIAYPVVSPSQKPAQNGTVTVSKSTEQTDRRQDGRHLAAAIGQAAKAGQWELVAALATLLARKES